jgi:para-aminobenzoate synthetase component 1
LRKQVPFPLADSIVFKDALLCWSQQFDEVVWLDSNSHSGRYSSFESILAADALTVKVTDVQNAFDDLKEYQKETNDWIFGYLSYDLKNDVEQLSSKNHDELEFPDLCFFQPKKIISIKGDVAYFNYLNMVDDEIETDFQSILECFKNEEIVEPTKTNIRIKMRIFKDEYFRGVKQMLAHIHRGDIYEANFCQEFYATDTQIDVLKTYRKLNRISKAPFATFLKLSNKYLLSASPERYLRKEGIKIISQPIKGTAKRSLDSVEDEQLKSKLALDEKERAENIMIVDLVRNDVSKSALKGSVTVEELCKVYSFQQVHQMISTITAEVKADKNPVEIIRETFPMGSMTGAPKISAMQIIEELEAFKRGLYSGAVGYFTPEGDFDFNVVIRSILYNSSKKYVSYSVGGAITAKAIPEKEYEECLLKAKAMREVLENV